VLGEPSPGIELERRPALELLDGVSMNDLNVAAAAMTGGRGRVVFAVSPSRSGLNVPSERELLEILLRGDAP
jgi:hypothetical protein